MKNYSLKKESIEVGVSAGVYPIFLTHFSQHYPKIPVFDESRTCVAFDMECEFSRLALASKAFTYSEITLSTYMMDEDDGDMSV